MPISWYPSAPTSPQRLAQQQESRRVLGQLDQNSPSSVQNRLGPILESKNQFGAPDLPFINTAIEAVDPGVSALAGLRRAAQMRGVASQEARNMALGQEQQFAGPEADLEDIESERAAGRQMLPQASALYGR